jgi:hypothetical protein
MKFALTAPVLLSLLLISASGFAGAPKAYTQEAAAATANQAPQNAAQGDQTAADVTGSWQVSWTGRNGDQRQATLQLKQDGDKLSGTFMGERGSVGVKGSVKGNQISFDVKMPRRKVPFSGTVDGNKMSGTTEQGASWSATRQ